MAINPITGAVIGGGINLLGNLLGGLFAGEDQKKAIAAAEEAQSIIDAVGAPPDTAKAIILNKFKSVGLETPELEQAVDIGVSKMGEYKEDPRFKEAGVKALEKMMQQSEQGLTAQDRLALREIQQEQERSTQGKLAQIRQEAQMRGMGGAGADLAAQLSAAQSGAERGLSSAMQVGAQAQQAKIAGIQRAAEMASGLRSADLATAQSTLGAKDQFGRFKAEEAMARQQRNIAAKNIAEQRNIARTQELANLDTAAANKELERQVTAEGTDWERGLTYGQTRAGTRTNMSKVYGQRAGAVQQSWGDMGKSTSDIFGAATTGKKYTS
jgi:hypothetical protein